VVSPRVCGCNQEPTFPPTRYHFECQTRQERIMNNIIYLVGLVVVVGAILSFVLH